MASQIMFPARTGPTSKVFRTTPSAWQDEGILVPHEGLRWWNTELLEIVEKYDPTNPLTAWKTKVLFDFLDGYYVPCVHHHHNSEELIYNPAIATKLAAAGHKDASMAPIKKEHEQLMDQLSKISAFRGQIEVKATHETVHRFKSAMKDMIKHMEEHFVEEEKLFPKALRDSGMTEDEETAVVNKIIQGLGLDGNKRFLPPILYAMCAWKGEKQMNEWLEAKVPGPIRMMLSKCWWDDFNQNQLKVLQGLKKDEELVPSPPSCGCSVQ